MPGPTDFAKMVPGFDFLQGLMKNAGAGMPGFGQWIAPTLDPDEIDKRIEQLRTVQFWLEQNAKMLAATIQALEVQRMTLSTLRTMNLPVDSLRDAMTIKMPAAAPAPAPEAEPTPRQAPRRAETEDDEAATPAAPAAPAVDPMQWWGALTKQFTELAAGALKETGDARNLAGAMMRQGLDAAGQTLKTVAEAPARAAAGAAGLAKAAPAAKAAKPAPKRPRAKGGAAGG